MRADRGEAFARRQPRGDDILDHHDARAGGNLEAAAQAELPLLAFDEHRVAAERPRGLIAGNDAADRRRDDEIDLPERLADRLGQRAAQPRSEEHTSELQSLMRISYAVFCLTKKNNTLDHTQPNTLI